MQTGVEATKQQAGDTLLSGLAARGTDLARRARKDLENTVAPLSRGWGNTTVDEDAPILSGVIEFEASALYVLSDVELERLAQVSLERLLKQPGSESPQVLSRLVDCNRPSHPASSNTAASAFLRFDVQPAGGDLLPMAAILRREETHQGALGLLPAFVDALDAQGIVSGHCRTRLSLDLPRRRSKGVADTEAPRTRSPSPASRSGEDPAASSAGRPPPLAVPPTAAAGPRTSHEPPSPTAANLARDPALRAKVMAHAIPIGGDGGGCGGLGAATTAGFGGASAAGRAVAASSATSVPLPHMRGSIAGGGGCGGYVVARATAEPLPPCAREPEPPSPQTWAMPSTAQQLNENPALHARVMRDAIPFRPAFQGTSKTVQPVEPMESRVDPPEQPSHLAAQAPPSSHTASSASHSGPRASATSAMASFWQRLT